MTLSLSELEQKNEFIRRHIGPSPKEIEQLLLHVGAENLDGLIEQTVPNAILRRTSLGIGEGMSEVAALNKLKSYAKQNTIAKSYIGMGYHDTYVPHVILRNVLENPGWYTAYTPYQPELAQGRLEALLNFQQLTLDLTGMDLASASLLDEATAAAEAMALAKRMAKSRSNLFFIDQDVHPQVIDVVKERASHFGFEVVVGAAQDALNEAIFGALLQYPSTTGEVKDLRALIQGVQQQQGLACVSTDLLALMLLKSPGELGADVVLGSAQRFGVPMGYGGPHAAFFATRDAYKRSMPGRIIGVSKDSRGKPALRMAMQTREQHIRREKANSNICTAQVLLANMASFYAIYHGPEGLKTIASRVHRLTSILALGLQQHGRLLKHNSWFDTLTLLTDDKEALLAKAWAQNINLRADLVGAVGISLCETTSVADLQVLFNLLLGEDHGLDIEALDDQARQYQAIPAELIRTDAVLTHEVFNRYHSETQMLRYIHRLEAKDLALNYAMISLGSCTMKLNATAEMIPITWPEFAQIHPFAPTQQCCGYQLLLADLEAWLVKITGYDAICMQPNSGAQGEYAGLLAIKKYHEANGQGQRDICLIPASAHGTNPASAQMAGLKVVVSGCDKDGNVDLADLQAKAQEAGDRLCCVMITYPSTHGVYEETIKEVCEIVHQQGGQVYLDGANMNAQVGLTAPGFIGADVSHLNLHKTFAIPHGGGGPGMGPIGVKQHLAPFVAGHVVVKSEKASRDNGAVSAAPFGSASILPISWMYMAMLGDEGLKKATEVAILNANYVANRLAAAFPVLYRGRNGRVAHECILDIRPLKEATGISEMDIAKRLMDYGFHAPTMSFPVAGTLMVEPTESESKAELDRFIDAMLAIREEIEKVAAGAWPLTDNPLVNAPHTQDDVMDDDWQRSYSRSQGGFPSAWVQANKLWPSVNRIDDVYGDRNLFCACIPTAQYDD